MQVGRPAKHGKRGVAARGAVGIGAHFFDRRGAIIVACGRLVFMLMMTEVLAGPAAFMHAVAARDPRTHLEEEGKAEHDDDTFDHPAL